MSRLDYVTIAIVAVCLLALMFLLYKTTNLLGGDKTEDPTANVIDLDDAADDETYTFDDEGEIISGDDAADAKRGQADSDLNYAGEEGGSNSDALAQGGSGNGSSPSAYGDDDDENVTIIDAPAPSGGYADDNDFFVLAGSFRVKDNAKMQVRKLKNMGYGDSEYALFNRGTYATVLVGRYDNKRDAGDLVNELNRKGVDAYVHKRRAAR